MKKSFGDYRFLAGNSGTRGSLWEGPDHLLYIETSGFLMPTKETYKRVDYAKIQTLGLGRTHSYFWNTFWLAAVLALCVWGVLANLSSTPAVVIFGALSAVLLLLLVTHLAKGPTCVCKLQTSVQVLRLKPLTRLRAARRCMARVTELCQQFQGQVQPRELPVEAPAAAARPHGVRRPFTGSAWLHWGLPLLLISGGLTILEPFIPQVGFLFADVLFALAASLLIVIGLAVNHRTEMPGVLRGALWGAVVNFMAASVLAYLFIIYASFQEARDMIETTGPAAGLNVSGLYGHLFVWMARAGFKELGSLAWGFVIIGGLNVFFALLGLPAGCRRREAAVVLPPPALQPAASEPPPQEP